MGRTRSRVCDPGNHSEATTMETEAILLERMGGHKTSPADYDSEHTPGREHTPDGEYDADPWPTASDSPPLYWADHRRPYLIHDMEGSDMIAIEAPVEGTRSYWLMRLPSAGEVHTKVLVTQFGVRTMCMCGRVVKPTNAATPCWHMEALAEVGLIKDLWHGDE